MTNPSPGWYPDPSGEPQNRWFNGIQWDAATQPFEAQPLNAQPLEAAPPAAQIPAGWYPDPSGTPNDRWWDGAQWQDATQPTVNSVAMVNDIPTYSMVAAQPEVTFSAIQPSAATGYTPMSGYSGYQPNSAPAPWVSDAHDRNPSTPWVWAIVWSPAIYAVIVVFIALTGDFTSTVNASSSNPTGAGVSLTGSALLIFFAAFDSMRLKTRGIRPFGWGWMFLGPLVYMIGRAVVVQQQAGRGVAPLIAWIAVSIGTTGVSVGVVLAVILPQVNALQ